MYSTAKEKKEKKKRKICKGCISYSCRTSAGVFFPALTMCLYRSNFVYCFVLCNQRGTPCVVQLSCTIVSVLFLLRGKKGLSLLFMTCAVDHSKGKIGD